MKVMLARIRQVERLVVLSLLTLMTITVVISTIELAWLLFQELFAKPRFVLTIAEMFRFYGFFLMVLLGLELIETIRAYFESNKFHVEVVFLVAMIAVTRKVIIIDYAETLPATLYGVAALIIALSAGFFLVKLALKHGAMPPTAGGNENGSAGAATPGA